MSLSVLRYFLILLFALFTSQAFCQSKLLEVPALKGDGIYNLLRRHGLDASYLTSFLELNKSNLGKDNSLYAGRSYVLPSKSEAPKDKAAAIPPAATSSSLMVHQPLFGKENARIEIKDQQLKGAVYYLVSGHAGPDPGAIGQYGPYQLAEDEYAYDVTIRLAKRLMEHGATVYMIVQDENDGIRDETILKLDRDEVNYSGSKISLNQVERLRQRTDAINKLSATHKGQFQRMLAIHVDSRSKGQNIDVYFYHHENSAAGQKLAESIHATFTSKYNRYQPNRDYFGSVSERSSLYVVKYSHPPTVFIELGNIRNNIDQRRFVIPNNRQALANWICEGILDDYKTNK